MHRYRTITQILFVLSTLNLVLAAPIVVQKIHEARRDEMVVAKDAAAMSKKWRRMEAANPSPDASPGSMASSGHASPSEASISSSYYYPSPPLSPGTPDSGSHYLFLLDRPQHASMGPQLPASLHESASAHPSSPGPPEIPLPELQGFTPEDIPSSPGSPPTRWQGLIDPVPLPHPHSPVPVPAPAHPSSSESSVIPPSRQLMWPDWPQIEAYHSPSRNSDGSMPSLESISGASEPSHDPKPEGLAPSHHSASDGSMPSLESISGESEPSHDPNAEGLAPLHHSASDESMPSLESISGESEPLHDPMSEGLAPSYYPAPDGSIPPLESKSEGSGPLHHPMPKGLAPSHHLISVTSDGSPLPPSLPLTKLPADSAKLLNKNMIKIVAGVTIIGGIIVGGLVGSHVIHRDSQDTA